MLLDTLFNPIQEARLYETSRHAALIRHDRQHEAGVR